MTLPLDGQTKMISMVDSLYQRLLRSSPEEVAKRVKDVRLVVDEVGDLSCYARSDARLIVMDSQLLEVLLLWSSMFSWAQLHASAWFADEDQQGTLSQYLMEFYVIQAFDRRISQPHWKSITEFTAVQDPTLGTTHSTFLFLAMVQFILCHELGHFFMHERHFKNAAILRRVAATKSIDATVPQEWKHEEEADVFGCELSFSVARGQSAELSVWHSTNDLASCLFMVFMSAYEYILATFVEQVRPDALLNFRQSHPPTRDRCHNLLHVQHNTDKRWDQARLNAVHQASLLNARIMHLFTDCNYDAVQKYGISRPSRPSIQEPELFYYSMEELYADSHCTPDEREVPRGVEAVITKFSGM